MFETGSILVCWFLGFERMFEKDAFRPIGTSVAASFVGLPHSSLRPKALKCGAVRRAGSAKFEPVRFWSAGFWDLNGCSKKVRSAPLGHRLPQHLWDNPIPSPPMAALARAGGAPVARCSRPVRF
jgi:hypothetical protein